jgi:hypothetical protein
MAISLMTSSAVRGRSGSAAITQMNFIPGPSFLLKQLSAQIIDNHKRRK